MKIHVHGLTDRGQLRPANEDALFIDEAHGVFAVADGLGGLPGGAEASQRSVELLKEAFSQIDSAEAPIDLVELTLRIHRIVAEEGWAAHPLTGTGTTLTLGRIENDQLQIAHVGDSAAYCLHDGRLKQITTDHTLAQELINRIGPQARESMPPAYPHTLTQCIGQEPPLKVDQENLPLQSGDRILFCTDGLNKVIGTEHIQSILESGESPEAIARELVDSANANNGPDNITVIVLIIQ